MLRPLLRGPFAAAGAAAAAAGAPFAAAGAAAAAAGAPFAAAGAAAAAAGAPFAAAGARFAAAGAPLTAAGALLTAVGAALAVTAGNAEAIRLRHWMQRSNYCCCCHPSSSSCSSRRNNGGCCTRNVRERIPSSQCCSQVRHFAAAAAAEAGSTAAAACAPSWSSSSSNSSGVIPSRGSVSSSSSSNSTIWSSGASSSGHSACSSSSGDPTTCSSNSSSSSSSSIDLSAVYRHNWAVPVVGFGSRLLLPVNSFEAWEGEQQQPTEYIEVPSEVFGQPLRPDILHQVYWHIRRSLAGWSERLQLYKWEWPGSSKKVRPQAKSGRARMGWRKACGKYLGVQTWPLRPHAWASKCNARLMWRGVEQALSAKFAQDQIIVVRDFNLTSHKTAKCVKHLRRLLGRNCPSALLIHEGHNDVNENCRWATAHITGVRRTDVAGVNAYLLLKHRMILITLKALQQLLFELQQQQQQRLPRYATPDGRPAPPPVPVPGWADEWLEIKARERAAKFDRKRIRELAAKWVWSSEPKGLLKLPRVDPLKGFRVARFSSEEAPTPGSKYEELYADDEPLEEDEEDIEQVAAALEARDREEAELLTDEWPRATNWAEGPGAPPVISRGGNACS
ncbi:50S ribosomal protein L4, putative [Eimeria tenella]|uniref:Large ribosomal subunit protein uL4m n=1 Tax=Eimeria tenella TaxID=5802 RepID=U6KL53_EIMTE|nr:50S ribosomal protein L4, putative [Eimeria tenella]CDJ36987.1 50S ribosomal protein L4, putative [Eimeria tenella]|eukprot:XP_013227825.1 50S ribosomal protein L4, putative [Eimeria tenella]